MPRHEQAKWRIATTIKEYANETDYKNNIVSNSFVVENNALTKNGTKAIFELISGIKNTNNSAFSHTRTYIAVSATELTGNLRDKTSLDGEIGRQQLLSTYPKIEENYIYNSNGDVFDVALLFSTTFYSDAANGLWQSFGIVRQENNVDTLLNCRNLAGATFTKSAGSVINITIAISIQ